jgi:hypothetical protein
MGCQVHYDHWLLTPAMILMMALCDPSVVVQSRLMMIATMIIEDSSPVLDVAARTAAPVEELASGGGILWH